MNTAKLYEIEKLAEIARTIASSSISGTTTIGRDPAVEVRDEILKIITKRLKELDK